MCFAMALKVTPTVEYTDILEFQSPRRRIRPYYSRIEIYQVGIVKTRALNGADAVSIVTCRARNLFLQVFGMLRKTFVV